MLNHLKNLTETLGGSNPLVDSWLQARKQLLVSWYSLVGIKPEKESHTRLDEMALDQFCHSLVDYLSSGHFKIYQQIIRDLQETSPLTTAVNKLYPQLEHNTQQIMDYYDDYLLNAIDHDNCMEFQQALSGLAEALGARFALEDKLIMLAYQHDLQLLDGAANNLSRPA
ncbi:regulator of sigma D [Salmonella enterica subsp. enterica serovar Choleraesuis]|nr:regulator of sigma D [Salmonella enterica subsp. enterica serovar Choleraesuis]